MIDWTTELELTARELHHLERGYVSVRMIVEKTCRNQTTVNRAIRDGALTVVRDGRQSFVEIASLVKWIGPTVAASYGLPLTPARGRAS